MLTHTHTHTANHFILRYLFTILDIIFWRSLSVRTVVVYERVFNAIVHSENKRRTEKKNMTKKVFCCAFQ